MRFAGRGGQHDAGGRIMLRCGPDDAPTLNFDTPVALTRYDCHCLHEKRQ